LLKRSGLAGLTLSATLAIIVAVSVQSAASAVEPTQTDPVTVTPGNAWTVDAPPSFTLTLDSAGSSGGLSEAQVKQAVEAANADTSTQALAGGGDAAGNAGGSDVPADEGEAPNDPVASTQCQWRVVANVPAGDPRWGTNDPAAGSLLTNACNGPETYLYVPNAAGADGAALPPPPPDPAELAAQARAELVLPDPAVHRSPPENNSDPAYGGLPYTWVGLSTFYWVDEWQPMTRTVELRGVSATVTATPTALTFDPGDGNAAVSCDGPGRPWVEADGNRPPSNGACGYTYRSVTPNGPLTATTSVQWSVSWTSNTGASGTFPASTTSSASSFLVEQIQVVIR
jgi:hypothetical protein